MVRVTFMPSGTAIDVDPGTTVFDAAGTAEVPIPSQCGGKAACALCRVKVVSGEDRVSAMRWEEEAHMGNVFFLTRERLSCELRVFGDVVVEIETEPTKEKPKGRYTPYSLIRKREKMEEEEELRRVRADARGTEKASKPRPSKPRPPADKEQTAARPPGKRRGRRKRGRNPGAPRPGDNRPPPGKSK